MQAVANKYLYLNEVPDLKLQMYFGASGKLNM